MKSVGRMWRRLRIAAVVTVLFCMSAVMAMAAGNNIETGDGDVVTPTPGETIKGEVAIPLWKTDRILWSGALDNHRNLSSRNQSP